MQNLSVNGERDAMTIALPRNISSLLALPFPLREGDILRHLQVKRETLKQFFAFDH